MAKIVKFGEALHRAIMFAMEKDPGVFVMGIGVDDHKAVFGSTKGLVEKFGRERVFDTPISEGAMTGVAIGAALGGLKPVHVHIRNDFLYLTMDQLMNMAAKWRYMFGGSMNVPIVVRAVVGRSWGQGAQHSQSLQSLFMHVPGLKVVMPTTAYDAQGLLLGAIFDKNPVVMIEHRLVYDIPGEVPDPPVAIPLKYAVVRRAGKDITLIANSYMAVECLKAAEFLKDYGIDAEVVDPVTLVPMDTDVIVRSVQKTGRALIVDSSWITCGMSAEVAAIVADRAFTSLKGPVKRLGMQASTCPVSKPLENAFYPNAKTIVQETFKMLGKQIPDVEVPVLVNAFKGPF